MINKNILEEQGEIRRLPTDALKEYAARGGGMTGILSAMELSRRSQENRSAANAMIAQRNSGSSVLNDLSRDAQQAMQPAPAMMNQGGLVRGYNRGTGMDAVAARRWVPYSQSMLPDGRYGPRSPQAMRYLEALRRREEIAAQQSLGRQAAAAVTTGGLAAGPIAIQQPVQNIGLNVIPDRYAGSVSQDAWDTAVNRLPGSLAWYDPRFVMLAGNPIGRSEYEDILANEATREKLTVQDLINAIPDSDPSKSLLHTRGRRNSSSGGYSEGIMPSDTQIMDGPMSVDPLMSVAAPASLAGIGPKGENGGSDAGLDDTVGNVSKSDLSLLDRIFGTIYDKNGNAENAPGATGPDAMDQERYAKANALFSAAAALAEPGPHSDIARFARAGVANTIAMQEFNKEKREESRLKRMENLEARKVKGSLKLRGLELAQKMSSDERSTKAQELYHEAQILVQQDAARYRLQTDRQMLLHRIYENTIGWAQERIQILMDQRADAFGDEKILEEIDAEIERVDTESWDRFNKLQKQAQITWSEQDAGPRVNSTNNIGTLEHHLGRR